MWRLRQRPPSRSLAAVQSGEAFAIARILGARTREFCHALGLHEGDVLRCREAGRFHLWLETPQGSVLAIERDHARNVEITPAQRRAGPTSVQ